MDAVQDIVEIQFPPLQLEMLVELQMGMTAIRDGTTGLSKL
jgi:hypothetical protein